MEQIEHAIKWLTIIVAIDILALCFIIVGAATHIVSAIRERKD